MGGGEQSEPPPVFYQGKVGSVLFPLMIDKTKKGYPIIPVSP